MMFDFISSAKNTVELEANAISDLVSKIDDNFSHACWLILACQGRVIITGVGKSGHIGRKIAATLASTGTPAFFVHAAEASHGDMGMFAAADIVIAISNSGSTEEVLSILPAIKRMELPIISMTGNPQSLLAKAGDIHLDISVAHEACPLDLTPTSSTTATLVMGDALAIALLDARGFKAKDFAASHPGGTLGRSLLLTVADIMHTGDNMPQVQQTASISQAIMEMTAKGLGMTAIIDGEDQLAGVFTDGDLRRIFTHPDIDIHTMTIDKVMTNKCKTITQDQLAASALNMMNNYAINAILVVDDKRVVGALNMHDLLKAKII